MIKINSIQSKVKISNLRTNILIMLIINFKVLFKLIMIKIIRQKIFNKINQKILSAIICRRIEIIIKKKLVKILLILSQNL